MKSKKRYFILSFMGENQDKSLAFASYDLVIDDFPSHKQIMDGINKRNPNITKRKPIVAIDVTFLEKFMITQARRKYSVGVTNIMYLDKNIGWMKETPNIRNTGMKVTIAK